MAITTIAATDIALRDDKGLVFTWEDGTVAEFSAFDLRAQCPCAACQDEWTGKRTLDPATIAPDIHPKNLELIGRYALKIEWSDGHSTGIYSWEFLHKLASNLNP